MDEFGDPVVGLAEFVTAPTLADEIAALQILINARLRLLVDIGLAEDKDELIAPLRSALARLEAMRLSQNSTSNDAAIWDKYPRPWRVEEDWTCEITAANGALVQKIMYPAALWLARLIVRAVNALPSPPESQEVTERDA